MTRALSTGPQPVGTGFRSSATARPTDGVSVDTGDLGRFVEGGQALAGSLAEIDWRLGQRRAQLFAAGLGTASGAPVDSTARPMLEAFHEVVVATNRHVAGVCLAFDSLDVSPDPTMGSGWGTPRAGAIEDLVDGLATGDLAPVTDTTRDAVAQAMLEGKTPAETGLDPRYFPPEYRDLVKTLKANTALRAELEASIDADPRLLQPSQTRARAQSDRERYEILHRAGLVGNDAGLLVVGWTGGFLGGGDWAGRSLAHWYLDGGPLSMDADSARMLGEQLNRSSSAAVAFYNTLGPARTGTLPARLGSDIYFHTDDPPAAFYDVAGLYSTALGDASQTGRLTFTGAELITAGYGAIDRGHTAVLFTTGEFDPEFLASATTAAIERHTSAGVLTLAHPSGSTSTNVLLNRAANTPGVPALAVDRLGVSGMGTLLAPRTGFVTEPQPDQAGSDPIVDDHIPDPVTAFITIAATDPEAAAIILQGAAPVDRFTDAAIAAGVDATMGLHATIMYEPDHLAERGVTTDGRLDQTDWLRLGLDVEDWQHIHDRVIDHGQGGILVTGNNALINEALVRDLDDGLVGNGASYAEMATTSGVLYERWFNRVVELRKADDFTAAGNNARLNGTISAVVTVATLPATPAVAATASLLATGGLAIHPLEPWNANRTVDYLEQQRTVELDIDRVWTDTVVRTIVAREADAGTPIHTDDGRVLTIEDHNGQPTLVATDTTTGQRTVNPRIEWNPHGPVGGPFYDSSVIYDLFRAGQRDIFHPAASPWASPMDPAR